MIAPLLFLLQTAAPPTAPPAIPQRACFPGEVKVEADRFTGERRVHTPRANNNFAGFELIAVTSEKGTREFRFVATSLSEGWRKCQSIYFLVDGHRFAVNAVPDREIGGGVSEVLQTVLSEEQARLLASAEVAEWRICSDEFQATPRLKCLARVWWEKAGT